MIDAEKTIHAIIKNWGFADTHEFIKIRAARWLSKHIDENILMFSQEQQFLSILKKLDPEIKKGSYTSKPALSQSERTEIEKIAMLFAPSFEEYAFWEMRAYCQEKINGNLFLKHFYQQKYQTDSLENASARFHDYAFDMIEKEDDLWAWEDAIDDLGYYQEILTEIENGRAGN